MPRQSRGRSTSTSRSSAPAPSQNRGAHTAAVPAGYAQPHAPAPPKANTNASTSQPQQPGLMAQMAATAGSVAIGSTVGHGISQMLFGGSNDTAPPQTAAPVQNQQTNGSCDFQNNDLTTCLKTANAESCTWFFEQLKACQAAASKY